MPGVFVFEAAEQETLNYFKLLKIIVMVNEYHKKYLLQRELEIRIILKNNPLITPYEIAVQLKGDNNFSIGETGGKISAIKRTIKRLANENKAAEQELVLLNFKI